MQPVPRSAPAVTAPSGVASDGAAHAAEIFLALVAAADAGGIARLLSETAVVDQPLWGTARGRAEIQVMVSRAGGWLGDRKVEVRHLVTTSNGQRAVAEHAMRLAIDGRPVDLPVAVVVEMLGGVVSAVRTYHSTWPMSGTHALRTPVLPHDPAIVVPGILERYQRALAAGDLEGILEAYEEDGYAREPSLGEYVYRGKARLRQIHTMQFSRGGIPLEYCSLTEDGARCAIEYNCVRWGRTQIVPQAGVAVYERGKTGRVAAARIYDDISPPAPPA
jgi:ketosteroid isomerase-like protein